MYWYLTILSYSLFVLAIALLFYRLHLLFTGSRVSGVVTNFITRNRSLTGTAKSTLIEISYKNSSGVDCKFEADNGLLVYIYKIGDSVSLSERNGKIIVNSLFNILTAPIFLFTMSYVIFNFLA
jgi:hypothetical protein